MCELIFLLITTIVWITTSLFIQNLTFLVSGILSTVLICIFCGKRNDKLYIHLLVIMLLSFSFMIAIYNIYNYAYGAPYYNGGSDDLKFETWGKFCVDQGIFTYNQAKKQNILYQLKYSNSTGFAIVLSWIMRFLGLFGEYHTLDFRIINISFWIIISLLVYKYMVRTEKFSRKQNITILYCTALFPNAIYLSSYVFRDTMCVLLVFSLFFLWDWFITARKNTLIVIISSLILLYLAYIIRSQCALFGIVAIFINILMKNKRISLENLVVFLFWFVLGLIIFNHFNILQEAEYYYSSRIAERIGTDLDIEGLSRAIIYIPIFPFGIIARFFYGFIVPFPSALLKVTKIFTNPLLAINFIVALGTLFQIYMLPYLFKGFKIMDKIMIYYLVMFLIVIGTTFTFRHFIFCYPMMFILMFREYYKTGKTIKTGIFLSVTFFISILASVYVIIKL